MQKYQINIPHFYQLEYCENGKKMYLEIDFRENFIELTMDLIERWEPPFEDETITDFDKKRILKNIYKYFIKKRKWGESTNITISLL